MRSHVRKRPNRNALCLCGSGRSFKNCCARKWAATPDKPDSLANQIKRLVLGLVVCVVFAGVIALGVTRPWVERPEPQPFEYDSERNRHWNAQEERWKDGRPPYHPWEYDSTRDRYFHPDDADWRPGRPPER